MTCHCVVTHAQATRYDQTQTTRLRQTFEGDIAKRFRKLKGAVNRLLLEDDAFGLKTNLRQFNFPRSDDKVSAFMGWLREQQRANGLEIVVGQATHAGNAAWANLYIRTAYRRGLATAATNLRGQGVEVAPEWVTDAFTRPFHADRAGLAFTRTFNELQGITSEMDRQISRIVAEGLASGTGPQQLARQINGRVDAIGITRARMLARTETIRAHAEASLNAYAEAGVLGVGVQAEWRTAQDASVCEECDAAAQAGPYTIEEARTMIPLHPNCRCAWTPVVENPREVALR
jgi:SPP1 gp7 family putative phage head morphogenesis protein